MSEIGRFQTVYRIMKNIAHETANLTDEEYCLVLAQVNCKILDKLSLIRLGPRTDP